MHMSETFYTGHSRENLANIPGLRTVVQLLNAFCEKLQSLILGGWKQVGGKDLYHFAVSIQQPLVEDGFHVIILLNEFS